MWPNSLSLCMEQCTCLEETIHLMKWLFLSNYLIQLLMYAFKTSLQLDLIGLKSGYQVNSLLISRRKHVVSTHWKCVAEALLMCARNVCFRWEKYRYFLAEKSGLSRAKWSSSSHQKKTACIYNNNLITLIMYIARGCFHKKTSVRWNTSNHYKQPQNTPKHFTVERQWIEHLMNPRHWFKIWVIRAT